MLQATGRSEEAHQIIRLDLAIELNQNRANYVKLFGGHERFDVIKNALTPDGIGPAREDKWMIMPDMGFLLAKKYKHVVILIGSNRGYSKNYFPLEGARTSRERLMCLGWVNGDHFMVIHLKPNCPLPSTSPMWDQHCLEDATKCSDKYIHRMYADNNLKRSQDDIIVEDYVTRPKIVVDLDLKDSIVPETVDLAED
ncbi:FAR1-related protein [Trifolium medium]|uniref:FAR1-related protein n=1 Tax=Trifolium medium TaxID=97028 RepID=A0A392P2I6_9FABA|nr:FAR1-related protein [Trifolium medium]